MNNNNTINNVNLNSVKGWSNVRGFGNLIISSAADNYNCKDTSCIMCGGKSLGPNLSNFNIVSKNTQCGVNGEQCGSKGSFGNCSNIYNNVYQWGKLEPLKAPFSSPAKTEYAWTSNTAGGGRHNCRKH